MGGLVIIYRCMKHQNNGVLVQNMSDNSYTDIPSPCQETEVFTARMACTTALTSPFASYIEPGIETKPQAVLMM